MRKAGLERCPGCGHKTELKANDSAYVAVACSNCGFTASTGDMMQAEFLANFVPLPSIQTAARRIAGREVLNYTAGRRR